GVGGLGDKYMQVGNAGGRVVKLPTLYLAGDDPSASDGSGDCVQSSGARLDAREMADAVLQEVTRHQEPFQQFHFFFFDNIDFPLPQPLTDSLSALFGALETAPSGYQLRTLSWLFNPRLAQ